MFHRSVFLFVTIGLAVACTSTMPSPTTCANPGGPVAGAADTHCGTKVEPTDPASCHPDGGAGGDDASADASGDAANDASIDAGGDDGGTDNPYGPTMFGTEADDDDCKYHVIWSASPVCENAAVTFTVTATYKTDGKPLTGAAPRAEVYLDPKHPAPTTAQKAHEVSPGKYTVGPIQFDAPGQWTVRFHFYELCEDTLDTSPHGHAAFFVQVP
jgi:hypothetical protein